MAKKIRHWIPVSIALLALFFAILLIAQMPLQEHLTEQPNIATEPNPLAQRSFPNITPETKDYVNLSIYNALQTVRPDKQGPVGPSGPPGPAGPSGGTYIAQGPLRNVQHNNMVCESTLGTSDESYVLLRGQTYQTPQTWLMSSDNKLRNFYNQNNCLSLVPSSDSKTQKVRMRPCVNATQWQYVPSNGALRTKQTVSNTGKKFCLAVSQADSLRSTQTSQERRKGSAPGTTRQNAMYVEAKSCNNSPEQSWAFY